MNVFHRRLDGDTIHKAFTTVFLYMTAFLLGCTVLCLQGISLDGALYESISAIGTVGLSLGVTPTLPAASRIAIILLMFVGRVGSMSVAMAVTPDRPAPKLRNIPEKVLIG